jgi:hypothetical protein
MGRECFFSFLTTGRIDVRLWASLKI